MFCLFAFGAFARYNHSPRLAAKFHLYKGTISGADANASNIQEKSGNFLRNLEFETDIYEVGLQLEFNILPYNIRENKQQWTPYVFGGIAGFHFNPRAFYEGRWYDLQPLGTEGQGLPGYGPNYSLYQFSLPAGIGFKIDINNKANFGIEFGMRKTFTDYIDDVSTVYPDIDLLREQRGDLAADLSYRQPEVDGLAPSNPEGGIRGSAGSPDWYMFGGLMVSINITEPGPGFGKRSIRKGLPIF